MPPTTAVAERCRMHIFDLSEIPLLVTGVRLCAHGHAHEQQRFVFHCTRCDFPVSMPAPEMGF